MASTTRQNYEQVSYRSPSLAQFTAQAREIIGDAVATRTLTAKESGALCLFDRAAGVVYTLPAPVIGMVFEFATTVTITSNAAKVITSAATEFILGDLQMILVGAATTLAVAGNGSTHRAISSNGTTTGGVIGDRYRLTAISSTQWLVDGYVSGTGTLATPFATS
jgi:hypothetical protein